ncbi:MAG: helix-turn-helix domain-containing protein [Bacteroidetes bacterium]|nr:helix-turn-helix domain-containing protein [Bacteroidota bacterium]
MLNLLNAIAGGSAIFLAFLALTVRQDVNKAANRLLGVFLFLVGLFMMDDSLLISGVYRQYPQTFGWINLILFALAPLLYLTVLRFVVPNRGFTKQDLWHFLPASLFLLISLPFLLSPDDMKLQALDAVDDVSDATSNNVLLILLMVQMVAYLLAAFRKLHIFRQNLEQVTASPEEVKLDWLLYFLWCLGIMVSIWLVELFIFPTSPYDIGWYPIAYLAGIYVLGFFALRQKEVFPYPKEQAHAIAEILEGSTAPVAKRRQRLDDSRFIELKSALLQKMETEKPYLNPELNLPLLASLMGLTIHEMSELINTGFSENFAQFVNRYRVEESRRLLLSEKHLHLNMIGIAFEAGFNSKTAFNMAFKKIVGYSPTEFRENRLKHTPG